MYCAEEVVPSTLGKVGQMLFCIYIYVGSLHSQLTLLFFLCLCLFFAGNERFRTLVEKRKRVYLTARFKREKRLIASSIVQEIQALDPPGRFLSRNAKKGTWCKSVKRKLRTIVIRSSL